jgi:catalase
MWDVWSRSPESLYTVTILFSGEGLPPIGVRPYRQVANDDYTPARVLFALFDGAQRQRLYDNIAAAMVGVPDFIIERQVAEFGRVDPAYGAGVLAAVMRGRQKKDVLF